MSYNILNKNVNFQGATKGTVEDLVDTHANQAISGSKDFNILTGSSTHVISTLSVGTHAKNHTVCIAGDVSGSGNISGSAFYGDGSKLTGIDIIVSSYSNGVDNRIITSTGTSGINGEANLTFDGSVLDFKATSISGSGNISGSIFYGSGAGLSAVPGSAVSLASNSGLEDSSGLRVNPNGMAAVGSLAGGDSIAIYSTGDSAPKKTTVSGINALAAVSSYANGTDNRVITSTGGSSINGEANLTFDGTDLLLTGNMSGSGTLQVGGTLKLQHASIEAPSNANDHILFIDANDDLVTKCTWSNLASTLAGDGLIQSSNALQVQTSGAVHITSDKVAITGSFADIGLSYDGNVNSISAIKLDLNSLTDTAINRANDYVVFIDADDGNQPKKEQLADVVGFIAGSGLDASSGQLSVDVSDFMSNGVAHRVLTATGTDAFEGEANLTFNGSVLAVTGALSGSGTFEIGSHITSSGELVVPNTPTGSKAGPGSYLALDEDGVVVVTTIGATSVDIDALSALGGTGLHQTQDYFMFSDNGTEKKITFSNLEDAIFSNINAASTDVSVAAGGAIELADNSVGTAEIATTIAGDGLTGGGGSALAVQVSGALKIASDKVGLTGSFAGIGLEAGAGEGVDSMNTINIDLTNVSALGGTGLHQTQDHFMFSDNGSIKKITFSNLEDAIFASVTGDAAIAAGGALTIGANAVEGSMLNSNVAGSGIDYTSNELRVDVSDFMANGANNRIVTATGTDAMNAESDFSFGSGVLQLTGSLEMSGSGITLIGGEAAVATLTLKADQGDDSNDVTTITVSDGGATLIDCGAILTLDSPGGTIIKDNNNEFAAMYRVGIELDQTYAGSLLLSASNGPIKFDSYAGSFLFASGSVDRFSITPDGNNVLLSPSGDAANDIIFNDGDESGNEVLRLDGSARSVVYSTATKTIFTPSSVTNFTGDDANATIPITATYVKIDGNGSARTGMRFAGGGTAGQFLIVENAGGENVTFHGTSGTALITTNSDNDTFMPGAICSFVSNGAIWYLIGGDLQAG